MFRFSKFGWLVIPFFFVIALFLAGFSVKAVTIPRIPWLSTSGRYIQDQNGQHVILRGISLVDIAVADSRTRNVSALIDMATDNENGWYARVVRLPIYPDGIDGQPGWLADPEAYFAKHLDPAIQVCINKQIYCIVDWHYIKDYTSSDVDAVTRAFWKYVAPKYAGTPNVIFELYNEPIYPDNWNTWKKTAQPWVDLIRSVAPRNLILIGGPRWSQNVAEAASSPFDGSNLVYVAHIYPDHGAQKVWDAWFGNSSNTVPYFITEWGWQQGGNIPTSGTKSGYGLPFSAYLDLKGVSWTAWVFDNTWQPVMFSSNWSLLGGEANMGQFTKDFLAQHRNDNLSGGQVNWSVPVSFASPATNSPQGTVIAQRDAPVTSAVTVGGIKVQIVTGGSDNNQQSAFRYRIRNSGSSAQANISVRIYFTIDGQQPASPYVLEKYYDQSGAATISGPTLSSGSIYYFSANYGATALNAGASWEFQTALRLKDWASSFDGGNDWWHTSGNLPYSYIDWANLPAYVNGARVWGVEPITP